MFLRDGYCRERNTNYQLNLHFAKKGLDAFSVYFSTLGKTTCLVLTFFKHKG